MGGNLSFASDKVEALKLLGFKSHEDYLRSNLFRIIRPLVMERDQGRCQFVTCQNRRQKPATEIVFLHRTLGAYLGVGIANLAATCTECAALNLDPQSMFFALTGMRIVRGRRQSKIGLWYRDRFEANKETARAVLAKLGEKNQRFVEMLIEREYLGKTYRDYLGLPPSPDAAKVAG